MKKIFVVLSLIFFVSTSFASNLKFAQSILTDKNIMSKATALAQKGRGTDDFMSIEIVSDEKEFEAKIGFVSRDKSFWSLEYCTVILKGKVDKEALEVTHMYLDSE